ncbi:MAG: hypothetical protein Q9220_000335 [cf. Caloplaca sp. 1 TL-2023]
MRPNFEACGTEFLNQSQTTYRQYLYEGPVHGILRAASSSLITVQGCRALCGTGIAYYPWKDSSNTITTWVLPIVGLLVQAPFQSNQAWQTVLLLARWLGSPIATLSYILWNIKVTGKCALMVDMATKYDEYPDCDSESAMMRDSLYMLAVMNQYSVNPGMPPIEAERLLRLVLFSNLLPLPGSPNDKRSLLKQRMELASNLREDRKKGVVPVFVSFLCTVDRNLVSADAIRKKLNRLIDDVKSALLDPEILTFYMRDTETSPEDFSWMYCLGNQDLFPKDFFVGFGGQGRSHWHYGVAHPLLAGMESKFMADYGRDWLRHGYAARLAMVVGSRNINGLQMFDPRMAWQITASICIIGGSISGAFVLSYFTPTVGLGCRSGGYLIYFLIALTLLVIELAVWRVTHHPNNTPDDIVAHLGSDLERHLSSYGQRSTQQTIPQRIHKIISWLRRLTFRNVTKKAIIIPLEIANTFWLAYIVFAQTLGSYQTCDCMSSNWSSLGGYLDFETYQYYTDHGIYLTWRIATGVSLLVMTLGLSYIAFEYCTQSHLSTEDYGRAMMGLKHTRWFKKHTLFIRVVPDAAIDLGKHVWHILTRGKARRTRRSLVWTFACKTDPPTIEARKEPGLRMQGTEEQWKDIFMSGRQRPTMGSSWASKTGSSFQNQSPSARRNGEDMEKGRKESL